MADSCPCYYCGRQAHLVCDYMDGTTACDRQVCDLHCVPEFEDGSKQQFTLCKDHADRQHKRGESIRQYFARMEKLA